MSVAHPTPRAPSSQQRKREEENAFMTLPDSEIAGCISDIGIPFSTLDLQKPNPQQIQRVFEWFAELLMNTTRESVSPAMRAAAEDICGQYSEIFTADTRDLMGFFVVLRKLLWECGVQDFTFQDLYKPTRERLVKIFSFIINFIRFRESQTTTIDEHLNKSEHTKTRIQQLYDENQDAEDHVRDLEANRKAMEAAEHKKEDRIKELTQIIKNLKEESDRLQEKHNRMRAEQQRLKDVLTQKIEQNMQTQQAVEKLRPYTEQSPDQLQENLEKLSDSLNSDRAMVENLERRARALQTSSDAFTTVTADIHTCTGLLQELKREMAAEEAMHLAAAKGRDALSERSNNVRDVERQETRLQKQLENINARTANLRKTAEERRKEEQKKMEELRRTNEGIRKERGESGREMEKRRIRIEQTEKKMLDLKENIEAEIASARDEYAKMEAHVRLYIKEMEQC
ncbi:MAG: hypothetical protein Q9159_006748, partial [Coniocarpon cinnabarinum]